ncbi:GNAT family N-acetyltransferase [Nocardioides campestrisoli]|uniref:GNAT family N-acetyltransferase n=1 Tax=Nocardioides campestrisoli TaxID=2736757 RepID=UPI0015E7D0BA|nr:GNAT family N-acetyltransferase [Nocardioides campestrisoli]
MRLTNIAHLRLPFGRLRTYELTVAPTGRALPVSFDQRRHVAAGDREGSWMALSFRLPSPRPVHEVEAAWRAVLLRQGTLRSVFSPGPDGPELQAVTIGEGRWVEHPIGAGQAVNDALRELLDTTCRPCAAPSHRLCLLETADGQTVVVAADHAHVDMWSMLVIARDLLSALDAVRLGHEPFAGLPGPPPFAEHTAALRAKEPAPKEVRERWRTTLEESGGVMPRFPMSLGEDDGMHRERVEVRDVLDVDESASLGARAAELGVSTLAVVVAAMTRVTRVLADEPLRAVFPVHSRYEPTWHDSVGWFITNSVLHNDDPDPRAAAAAVKDAVRLGSWPLEDVLAPWGGMPEAPGMFAISWLDLRRLPVRVDATGLEAQYVGASILTDGVMLWFVLDETGLHLRCRYPDTDEARRHVGRWLDLLVTELRRESQEAAGGLLTAGGRTFRLARATRRDVPALVALLAGDEVGAGRESDDLARYEAAYDRIARDPGQLLVSVRDEQADVVATMQLSVIPGLSREGTTRLQVEGVRVDPALRGAGLGTAMLEWAHEHGRARGATLAQLTSDARRADAHRFYARLGYVESHRGLKRPL